MCKTIEAILQTLVCLCQMIVRIFMTTVLMFENLLRLFMQTIYNMISFIAQMLSLIPICCVFLITSKFKHMICGGGGSGGPNTSRGTCDCVISTLMVVGVFIVFKEVGVLDRIMVKFGYIPTKGLREKLIKSKVTFPQGWTIPREWKALRSGSNTIGRRSFNESKELEVNDTSSTTEPLYSSSTDNSTTVFYYVA